MPEITSEQFAQEMSWAKYWLRSEANAVLVRIDSHGSLCIRNTIMPAGTEECFPMQAAYAG